MACRFEGGLTPLLLAFNRSLFGWDFLSCCCWDFSKGLACVAFIIKNNQTKHVRLVERKHTKLIMGPSRLIRCFLLGGEAGGGGGVVVE